MSFDDGSELDVDAVIWATGYRPDHSWIELPVFGDDGSRSPPARRHRRPGAVLPRHYRGSTPAARRCSAGSRTTPSSSRTDRRTPADPSESETEIERSTHSEHSHADEEEIIFPRTTDFPTAIRGPSEAGPSEVVELADGDAFDLRIAPVTKRLGDATVRMLAYNGSIPGPTLRVRKAPSSS